MMFTERVKLDKTDEYEAWTKGILDHVKEFSGYLGADVIRPEESSLQEYITLIRFDSCLNLKAWRESSSLAEWQNNLAELLVATHTSKKLADWSYGLIDPTHRKN